MTMTTAGAAIRSQLAEVVRSAPRRRHQTRRDRVLAFWLIAPTAVLLVTIIGYPVLRAMWRSLYSDSITGESRFVWLENYITALVGSGSADFWAAFRFTVFFAAVTLLLEVLLGLAIALIMNRALRGRGLLRISVLIPWGIPTAVTAVLWLRMLQPDGVVNSVLGLDTIWTGSEWPAKWALITAETWRSAPFVALLLLVGLKVIPAELYESAKVDGAGVLARFKYITLPMLRPALLVAVVFRMMDALRVYDLPQIMTRGANNTASLSYLTVEFSINQTKYGYGSALSTLTFLLIFAVAYLFVRTLGANVVQSLRQGVQE
jgi:ABC-type sugar transport system permease subunit